MLSDICGQSDNGWNASTRTERSGGVNEDHRLRKVHFPIEQTMVVGYGEKANMLFNTSPYWSEHIHELAVECADEDEPYLLLENPKVARIFRVTVEVEDITEGVKEQFGEVAP